MLRKTISLFLAICMLGALTSCHTAVQEEKEEVAGITAIRLAGGNETEVVPCGDWVKGYFSVDADIPLKPEDFEPVSDRPEIATIQLQGVENLRADYIITGISAGETTVWLQTGDGILLSEKIRVTVRPKLEEQDNRTVYITPEGKKYHYSKACAGKNAIETTLEEVQNISRIEGPCKTCTQ